MSRLGLPGNRLPVKQSQLPPVRAMTAARGRGPRCSPFCAATGLTPTVETPGQRGARRPGPRVPHICPIAARCPSRPASAVRSPCAPSRPLGPSRSRCSQPGAHLHAAGLSFPAARGREDPRGAQAGPLAQQGGRRVRGLRHIDLHAGTRDTKGLQGTGWERSGRSPSRDSEAGLSALCDRPVGGRGQLAVRSHLATAASRSHPLQKRPQARPAGQRRTSAQPRGAHSPGWAPNDVPLQAPPSARHRLTPLPGDLLGVSPVSTRLSSGLPGSSLALSTPPPSRVVVCVFSSNSPELLFCCQLFLCPEATL